MKQAIAFGMLLALCACGSAQNAAAPTASTAPIPKSLFSKWVMQTPSTGATMDFSQMAFGANPLVFFLADGSECDCTIFFGGSQAAGNFVLSGCFYKVGSSTGGDPGCATFDGADTYTITLNALTMCKVGSCSTWN